MTIPKLWERVTLRSYAELRYIDGRPEGFGGGSPFAMGLSSLVCGNNSSYVKYLRLVGEYQERDVEEYSKGRVPNNAMMMNISLRAAIDRLPLLETFKFVYRGMRPTLIQANGKWKMGTEYQDVSNCVSRPFYASSPFVAHAKVSGRAHTSANGPDSSNARAANACMLGDGSPGLSR
jgi:hypothetical protein